MILHSAWLALFLLAVVWAHYVTSSWCVRRSLGRLIWVVVWLCIARNELVQSFEVLKFLLLSSRLIKIRSVFWWWHFTIEVSWPLLTTGSILSHVMSILSNILSVRSHIRSVLTILPVLSVLPILSHRSVLTHGAVLEICSVLPIRCILSNRSILPHRSVLSHGSTMLPIQRSIQWSILRSILPYNIVPIVIPVSMILTTIIIMPLATIIPILTLARLRWSYRPYFQCTRCQRLTHTSDTTINRRIRTHCTVRIHDSISVGDFWQGRQ